ncbi:Riboflavin transporter MCH5 [Pleurostoma richardsiae]|uniref:Riboflavin transporter MCH5 n=1 Tax=Pleurostoma richardsiae TaxID=41990 RepID=A0AA38RY72_9PEZI|nr:Riboflavin transporter MCH5 [Pleurostoma richardsiae]
MLCVFGLINSSAVFESYFAAHQLAEYSPSQRGWVFSLNLFCVFFLGLQVGPVYDRFGPRVPVALGSILVVGSLFLLGFCTTYCQIVLAYAFLGGSGGALLLSPSYGCIAHFFNVRRGLATGIATTAGGVGGVVFPLVLKRLLPALGFQWATRIMGVILLVVTMPANLCLRSRLPPRTKEPLRTVVPDFGILRDHRYALASMATFFMEWGLFIPVTFIVSFAASHGQDPTSSYILLSTMNAGSVAGRCLPGLAADSMGPFNVIILTVALCTGSTLGLWLLAGCSRAMLIAFAVVFGFASGSNLGLGPVCLGQLCDVRDYGRFLATANFVASFGSLTSVPIGGALLGMGGGVRGEDGSDELGWTALILFSGCSYALALVCYVSARVLAVGWGLRTKF